MRHLRLVFAVLPFVWSCAPPPPDGGTMRATVIQSSRAGDRLLELDPVPFSGEQGTPDRAIRLDRELNELVSDACRNAYAKNAMELIHGLSRRFWYMHYRQVLDLPLCARLHAELADTIRSGHAHRAARSSDRRPARCS